MKFLVNEKKYDIVKMAHKKGKVKHYEI